MASVSQPCSHFLSTIRQVSNLLHPPSAKAKVMAVLRAYFDESGTHWGGPNAAKVFVMCGYIAPESAWEHGFESRWRTMLDRDGIKPKPLPYFHATEVEGGKYPFNRMHESERKSLKDDAVTIAITSGLIGVSGALVIDDFKKVLAPYISEGIVPRDPYPFLFADVLAEAIRCGLHFIGENQNEPIAFVFDQHPRWSITAHSLYSALQNDTQYPDRGRLGVVAFEDKKRFMPLQAADHLAFETYHYTNGGFGRPKRTAMQRFSSWPQNHGRYYDEQGLHNLIKVLKERGAI